MAEGTEVAYPGEKEALGRCYCSLELSETRLQRGVGQSVLLSNLEDCQVAPREF